MRVLVSGAESSGTHFVMDLLAAGGADVTHRSQPNGDSWIDLKAMMEGGFDHCVVVVRGFHAHCSSQVRRNIEPHFGMAVIRRQKALRYIAPILGDERTILVTYESLAALIEREVLLDILRLDVTAASKVEWHDENEKYS